MNYWKNKDASMFARSEKAPTDKDGDWKKTTEKEYNKFVKNVSKLGYHPKF